MNVSKVKNKILINFEKNILIKKERRYKHITKQLENLLTVTDPSILRMATISTLLYNKMKGFSWTGFYLLQNGELLVSTYHGLPACQKLKKNTGVCWAAINQNKTIIVPNVHEFPGHIACDSSTNSEIVTPVYFKNGLIFGVLDIDSKNFNQFDETDALWLEKISKMVFV